MGEGQERVLQFAQNNESLVLFCQLPCWRVAAESDRRHHTPNTLNVGLRSDAWEIQQPLSV